MSTQKTPANITPVAKNSATNALEPAVEPTSDQTADQTKPKSKLSWKERLAQLPEEEAKVLRAKAAEASRISKAKKRGTNPEKATVDRLEARLTKIDTQLAELKDSKVQVTAELNGARKALVAAEKQEKAEAEITPAESEPTAEIGMTELGDTEGYPTEKEYTDGAA